MVRHDGVDHVGAFVILARKFRAQLHVRALGFMVDGLADIVQKTGALGKLYVGAELGGHNAGQMADLDGVLEHVLTVAGAIAHAAQELDQLAMDAVHDRFRKWPVRRPR